MGIDAGHPAGATLTPKVCGVIGAALCPQLEAQFKPTGFGGVPVRVSHTMTLV